MFVNVVIKRKILLRHFLWNMYLVKQQVLYCAHNMLSYDSSSFMQLKLLFCMDRWRICILLRNMSFVKSEKQNEMIEEVNSAKEKAVLGNKRSKNDLNIQMTKTPDFNRSISLQSSKKRDQKGCRFQRINQIFLHILWTFNLMKFFNLTEWFYWNVTRWYNIKCEAS